MTDRGLAADSRFAIDRERVDFWCERVILGLVLAVLVFSPLATGAVRPQDFLIVQWLVVGVLVVWAVRFCINPKHRLFWPPVCWAVIAFMAYAVGRYATAEIEYLARQEMIKVLLYGFLFLAVLNNLHRQETTGIIGMTLVFLGMAIALYALIQFLTDSNTVWHFIRPEGYRKRGSGTFICPNNMAGYLEMLLPLGLAYTLTGRFTYLQKIFLGYASLAIFTGITVSVSRAGWLAAAAAIVVLFVFMVRQRDYRLQVAVLAVIMAAIATVFFTKADLSLNRQDSLRLDASKGDLRVRIWSTAWKMWQDHPIWGVGPAHFDYRYRAYRPADDQMQHRPDRVHNDYLNTLVDWGIIGGALVLSAWVLFFSGVWRSWKHVQRAQNDLGAKRSNRSSFVLGGALGLIAILVHSFFDFNMHIPANAILAVTLMALVAGHFRFATEAYWHTVRWPLRLVVGVVLVAGIGYLAQQTWQRTREQRWLSEAESLPHYSTAQLAAWEKAFAIDGRNFETAYNIGESLRLQSWHGAEGYEKLTMQAMEWFERCWELNPYDPYSVMRYGMCLHWLRRPDEAGPYFERALKLDPNSYYVRAHMGWHHIQIGELEKAWDWMQQSLRMRSTLDNTVAWSYLQLLHQRGVSK